MERFSHLYSGLSTALFTGVYLSDVLEACGTLKGAKHCIFEVSSTSNALDEAEGLIQGIDALPNGSYGTSQKLSWAKDRTRGMLLSWAMNGLPLEVSRPVSHFVHMLIYTSRIMVSLCVLLYLVKSEVDQSNG